MKIFKSFNHNSGTKFFFYSLLAGCSLLQAQMSTAQTVSITTPGTPYTQNFDALAISGTTNNLTIPGWYLTETGGGARDNEQYAFDNGASSTGDCYSYGTTAATERALGTLRSGTLIGTIGAAFTNNTGATVTSVDISYTGEEWRLGTAGRTDALNFEYSLDATSLTTGTWTAVSALNFVTPSTVTAGAKDGNAAANHTALSSTISALTIANGATVWIRWDDIDATSADDGLAVDDFSLTAFGSAPAPEINVQGNSATIFNNDATPSTTDFTDFGATSVCSGTISHTFTVSNYGTADLTLSGVTVSGTNASDFTVSTQPTSLVSASGSTTFTVTFDPSASGTRTAVLSIANNDADENPYTFSIQGMGYSVVAIIFSSTNVSCAGGSNGAATISAGGGTAPYTYSWAPSGGTAATASGLTANTYTCTVTDSTGCTTTATTTITEPAAITSTISAQTNVSCFGGTNGAATVAASGGTSSFTYAWAPSGGTTATISGVGASTYTCTITDANGCIATQTVTITAPSAITFTPDTHTDISCNGGSNGTAAVTTATGGTGAFTYDWAPGTPAGDGTIAVTGLSAGSYTCTATDDNGCTATASVAITEPAALTASAAATTSILCNGATADITVSATGGTGTYTGTGNFTVNAGTYNYTVTDANGCSGTTNITVTQPDALVASSSAAPVLCNGSTTSVTVNATGGTGAYTGTGNFTVNAGTYNYTITDVNGCSATTGITLTEPAIITAAQTIALCNGETLTVGAFTHSSNGTYTDTIASMNGCDSIVTSSLTINAAINASASLSGSTITASPAGATYQWIDCTNSNAPLAGETAQSYTAAANGNFAVVVTVGSCSDTSSCVAIVGTGINAVANNSQLSIYPNPANDVITVQVEAAQLNRAGTLFLYNSTGQLISKTLIGTAKTEINVSSLPKGIYFITLQDQYEVITKKITKQ